MATKMLPPIRVSVTGAAGAIGYALCMRLASGEMLGKGQPVILQLIETKEGMKSLQGVVMELKDGAFPLLQQVMATDDLTSGFGDANIALLVGAKPRGPGMERKDLMSANAKIFAEQGKVINSVAAPDLRVLVIGNPANTNALVLAANAPDIWPEQIMAMTRLDQNRASALLAEKAKCDVSEVDRVIVWGNHSSTQYPDLSHATVRGNWAKKLINDDQWIKSEFIPKVQKRGAEIIEARGASSAASAASAAVDHMRDYWLGSGDKWQSIALPSDGSYGVDPFIWYSLPCVCHGGHYKRVLNLPIDEFSAQMMNKTLLELKEERDAVRDLLGPDYGKAITFGQLKRYGEAKESGDATQMRSLAAEDMPSAFKKGFEQLATSLK
eukprot:CAMPEP_0184677652 /NCGR_PEP_ID=MMETSP0312-20130426/217_1 /TAXON_ID=31354 /ORGANISM="Compsopogon coeruleus, Strain SAG 36.94" /LENGTH=381 /DNA_ID=CAMNT_0027125633 /DNA_START=182 /DNA_END=1327 /DNA_ORIENTATION=-